MLNSGGKQKADAWDGGQLGGGFRQVAQQQLRPTQHVHLGQQRLLVLQVDVEHVADHVGQHSQAARRCPTVGPIVLRPREASAGRAAGPRGASRRRALRRASGTCRVHVVAQFGLRLAETPRRGQFAHQPHPPQPQQQHVVRAVGQAAVGDDPAKAGHRIQRRPALVVPLPAGRQRRHGDQPVAGQRILQQIAIPRLEDVQRLHDVRKQHQIRQRKQPHLAREIPRSRTADRRTSTCRNPFPWDYRQPVRAKASFCGDSRHTPCAVR